MWRRLGRGAIRAAGGSATKTALGSTAIERGATIESARPIGHPVSWQLRLTLWYPGKGARAEQLGCGIFEVVARLDGKVGIGLEHGLFVFPGGQAKQDAARAF